MKPYGFNLSEILEEIDKTYGYKNEEERYTEEILEDIDNWLKEESKKEEYLEVEFRGKGKKFEFEVIELDK